MTCSFKVAPHTEHADRQMVEVWLDGHFVGALYAGDRGDELKFISKHLLGATLDERHPPSVVIALAIGKGEGD